MAQQESQEGIIDWGTAPGALRAAHEQQAKELKDLREKQAASDARLAAIDHREKFESLKGSTDTLKDLTPDDVKDIPADQLSTTILEAKAIEKARAKEAAELTQAKALGYESLETYKADIAALQAKRTADTRGMASNAAAAASGPGEPEAPKSRIEVANDAYKEARAKGMPQDKALGLFLGESFARQMEEQKAAANS
jgi:hypothetical protein